MKNKTPPTQQMLSTAYEFAAFMKKTEILIESKGYSFMDIVFVRTKLIKYKKIFTDYNEKIDRTLYDFTDDIALIDILISQLNHLLKN